MLEQKNGGGQALPQTPTRPILKKMTKLFLTIVKSLPGGFEMDRMY